MSTSISPVSSSSLEFCDRTSIEEWIEVFEQAPTADTFDLFCAVERMDPLPDEDPLKLRLFGQIISSMGINALRLMDLPSFQTLKTVDPKAWNLFVDQLGCARDHWVKGVVFPRLERIAAMWPSKTSPPYCSLPTLERLALALQDLPKEGIFHLCASAKAHGSTRLFNTFIATLSPRRQAIVLRGIEALP